MFELNRTQARWAFKDLLGQANHFLITILVGLDGVRTGKVELSPEFRTSWNPQSIPRSADRSRHFVLDLALIRAVDAFDTYMMMSARKPSTISNQDFRAAMDGSGRSVAKRLKAFDEHLAALQPQHKAILSIAIEWRNQRVHSLSEDLVEKQTFRVVQDSAKWFQSNYSGLDVDEFISHFNMKEAPTFKEAASVIRLVHEAVAQYDADLLKSIPIETYLKEALLRFLETDNPSLLRSIQKTWGHQKKRTKVIRLLRMVGVNQTDVICGREVPETLVEELVGLESGEVLGFLQG
jgi:hypothetical protein